MLTKVIITYCMDEIGKKEYICNYINILWNGGYYETFVGGN